MATYASGLASGTDLVEVTRRACDDALRGLDGATPTLAVVWVSGDPPDLVGRALAEAAEVLGADHVIGCSAGGVLGVGDAPPHGGTGARAVEGARAASVWLTSHAGLSVRVFHLEVLGDRVVGMPIPAADESVAVLLGDPWSFPTDGWLDAVAAVAPALHVVGGLAHGAGGGDSRLLVDGVVHDRGAVGVLLGGAVTLTTLVSQGCRPVGPAMTVTGVDGRLVTSLAFTPAVSKLQQVLGELDEPTRTLAAQGLQLGITLDQHSEEPGRESWLVRPVLGVDAQRQAVEIAEVLEVGATVSLMVRDATGAADDLIAAVAGLRGSEAALLVTCNGRGTAMFPSADHDVVLLDRLLGGIPIAGFFAGGEIAWVHGRNHLLGFTASVLGFKP